MNQPLNKIQHIFLFLIGVFAFSSMASAQINGIWTGADITFTKKDYASHTSAANQDRLTDTVWITRQTTEGIFNIKTSSGYATYNSPKGTKWAFGTTADVSKLTFRDWQTTVNDNPPGMVNRNMVLYLEVDSIYIDIKFTSWTQGGAGGGFSYVRSTDCRSFVEIKESFCDSLVSPSKKYVWKKAGVYQDTILNKAGCDSIMTFVLNVYDQDTEKKFYSGCGSVTLPISKRVVTATGTYTDTLKNGTVCGRDSFLIANVFIYNVPTKSISVSACDSFRSPSGKHVWKTSGTYQDVLAAVGTCDTALTVELTINNSKITKVTEAACEQYISASNNMYTASGNYLDTLQTSTGCDSIIDLSLTINNAKLTKQNRSICAVSYPSPSGKYVWGKTGIYRDTLMSRAGCDSVLEINLTINPFTSSRKITSCEPISSPSNKTMYTVTGIYYDTLNTVDMLCDSVVETDFTKIEPSTSSQTISAAINRYHSPSGNYIWTSNGIYTDTIPNEAGCDSVMTFDLTVETVSLDVTKTDDVLTAVATGVDYQWLDCNDNYSPVSGETSQSFTVTKKGRYAVELSNQWNKDTSECIEMNLSIDKLQNPFGISIFPNPNNGTFTIDLKTAVSNVKSIGIYTANGTKMFETTPTSQLMTIDLPSSVSSGVYFIRVYGNDFVFNSLMIVD